jgi:hypothetical protein
MDRNTNIDTYLTGVRCLIKLASESGVLPPSLFIKGVEHVLNPEEDISKLYGGSSDINRGIYRGEDVALKRLRIRPSQDKRFYRVSEVYIRECQLHALNFGRFFVAKRFSGASCVTLMFFDFLVSCLNHTVFTWCRHGCIMEN